MNDYLQHHGILGMKWGVRRYQNADGTLTSAGKQRYNKDSDDAAMSLAKKYSAIADLQDKKNKASRVLASNPKKFNGSKEREDYLLSYWNTEDAYKQAAKTTERLLKKYKDVKVDIFTEDKTGEQYVRSELLDKLGNMYVSEFYLGAYVKQ